MVCLANHGASPIAIQVHEQVEVVSVLSLGNAKSAAIEALTAWVAKFQSHYEGYNLEIDGPR